MPVFPYTAELLWPRPATFAISPPQSLASRGSNSETVLCPQNTDSRDQLQSSAPLRLGSPFSHQLLWTAPGQCIALVNLPRPLPLRGCRRPRCPRTLQLISRSPMRFWSVGLALPPGSVSSLRRHGSFGLPHGALRCSQSRQFLPSLGLDDQRPHLRPVVAPRPLYMSSNSRPRAHPRCRCKYEARRPHGKRGRGRWGPAESTDHNASSATNARQQVFDA